MEFNKVEQNRLSYGSYVSMQSSLLYMETPKAACSSFKHLIAALNKQNQKTLHTSVTIAKTATETIHDRKLFKLPSFIDLSIKEREQILTSDNFLRFCVVRNPLDRLASAWADKFLCYALSPDAKILQKIDFPEYIPDWVYLRGRFNEFITHLYNIEYPNLSNHHWQPYHRLLLPNIMNYNLVIKLEELKFQLPRFIKHIERQRQSWPGLPKINESPFSFSSNIYTPSSMKKVLEMFKCDFVDYGYDIPISLTTSNTIPLPPVELITAIQQRNQRISYLSLKLNEELKKG